MVDGPPLVAQWIRLQCSAGCLGSIPTQGTRSAATARSVCIHTHIEREKKRERIMKPVLQALNSSVGFKRKKKNSIKRYLKNSIPHFYIQGLTK